MTERKKDKADKESAIVTFDGSDFSLVLKGRKEYAKMFSLEDSVELVLERNQKSLG